MAYLLGGYQSRVGLKVARPDERWANSDVKFGERDVNPNLVTLTLLYFRGDMIPYYYCKVMRFPT